MNNNIYYPLNDNIGSVQLVQHVGDDKGIINSARCSFGKRIDTIEEKDLKLLKYLHKEGHHSPFEHNSITFLVKAPIFIARQHFRHRISSFNEISGRYVEVKEEFYIPKEFRQQSTNNRQASIDEGLECAYEEHSKVVYAKAMKDSFRHYQELIKAGVCREQARGVLPLATYTEYYWTCNLRACMHFIKLRDHENAQWEIQQYAKAMKEIAKEIFPETFKIWSEA